MRRQGYPAYTQVETKDRYVKVKLPNGKWEGLGRHLLKKSGADIEDGYRVFFKDGDRLNRHVSNLTAIKFNNTRYILLSHSRVIYLPTQSAVEKKQKELAGRTHVIAGGR